jgi:carbamoyltransferase
MPRKAILGISAYYHDSAAALLVDGRLVAAAQEERFSRKKHDSGFPGQAINYVLLEGGLAIPDLSAIIFYDKPYLKFERLLETYHALAPNGLPSFLSAIPVWIKEKLFMRKNIWNGLERLNGEKINPRPILLFSEHHLSHAASAFFPSPFEDAAILTVDGVGEWATTTICKGHGNKIDILQELMFPHSIGLLYSAFTQYCGFKVNSGEYKLMGLAPYGTKGGERTEHYKSMILENIVDVKSDGSVLLNMSYFNFATGLTMCRDKYWQQLFDIPKRSPESTISEEYMDLALAIQEITENIMLRLARTAKSLTSCDNLVLAGGVALNCVANGKLIRENIFNKIWVQPAAGDAGGALGAAYTAWHIWMEIPRALMQPPGDAMQGSYLGPEFSSIDIHRMMRQYQAPATEYHSFQKLCEEVTDHLQTGKIIGWFQGRMEWGPRALGNRSILGDPRNPETQKTLNLKIKYRESFRPFAPSILAEDASDYFDLTENSPYMLLVAPVLEKRYLTTDENDRTQKLYDRLYQVRTDIPAVTHVDFSARVQTVHRETNPRYWRLINTFKKKTGCSLLVNTSFNVRGEPIVCTPEDAYTCFMRTEMDYLVIENFLFTKKEQPPWEEEKNWRETYELD